MGNGTQRTSDTLGAGGGLDDRASHREPGLDSTLEVDRFTTLSLQVVRYASRASTDSAHADGAVRHFVQPSDELVHRNVRRTGQVQIGPLGVGTHIEQRPAVGEALIDLGGRDAWAWRAKHAGILTRRHA
jgi:hypothetical protein